MARCSFCRHNIEFGTGKMLILKDGRVLNFCSRKCEKNQLKLGRVGRETKWTYAYRIEHKTKKAETKQGSVIEKKSTKNSGV